MLLTLILGLTKEIGTEAVMNLLNRVWSRLRGRNREELERALMREISEELGREIRKTTREQLALIYAEFDFLLAQLKTAMRVLPTDLQNLLNLSLIHI